MTKKEARNLLNNSRPKGNNAYSIMLNEALDMAIQTLDQKPCEDAISRQAVDEIKELMTDINGDTVYAVRMSDLRQLSSVTSQPKTGRWIYTLEDWNKWECSECGFTKRTDVHVKLGYNYCPNCGVKMIKETKE